MAHLLHTTFVPSISSLRRTTSSATQINISAARRTSIEAKIREITMPVLSSTMTEGEVVSWTKYEGDKVSKGESVVVVKSDKADMDVETFHDGFLAAIMVEDGGFAPVGSVIGLLAETEEEIAEARSKVSTSSSSAATAPGITAKALQPEKIEEPVGPSVVANRETVVTSSVHPTSEGGKRIVASPYAKKLAKELKVELAGLVGTGPMGRIVAKDVEEAAAVAIVAAATKKPATTAPGIELGSVVPFTIMQGAVSRNMVESLTVPTFRVGYTITTDALDGLYKKVTFN